MAQFLSKWRRPFIAGCAAALALAPTAPFRVNAEPSASVEASGPQGVGGARWRLRHGRELQASAGLPYSEHPNLLPEAKPISLDDISFQWPTGTTVSFETYRHAMVLDGFLVLKDGHVIFERYYDGFQPRDTHTWASMSKSVVGVIALRLAKKGVVDLAAPVSRYVPELAGSPFGTATLQQNLDMHVSATYPKDLPPDRGMFAAAGVTPAPPGAPTTIHDFLRVVLPGSEPSGVNFYYQNGSTEAVAWALERASGQTLPDLVRQYVWTPMGASEDGYYLLDRSRTAFASGGLFSTLRDLARFGEFIRQGLANDGDAAVGQRLLSWSQATPSTSSRLKYRDFWWHDQRAAFAIGRYGQRLAVIPDKHLVIAQFGAYEDNRPRATTTAEGAANHSPDLRDSEAFEALALAIADRL